MISHPSRNLFKDSLQIYIYISYDIIWYLSQNVVKGAVNVPINHILPTDNFFRSIRFRLANSTLGQLETLRHRNPRWISWWGHALIKLVCKATNSSFLAQTQTLTSVNKVLSQLGYPNAWWESKLLHPQNHTTQIHSDNKKHIHVSLPSEMNICHNYITWMV